MATLTHDRIRTDSASTIAGVWSAKSLTTRDDVFDLPDAIAPSRPVPRVEPYKVNNFRPAETDDRPEKHERRKVVKLNQKRKRRSSFKMLQQWEGAVTSRGVDSFWAELVDLTSSTKDREVVELPLDEISADDLAILRPGAVFYWSIGYEINAAGTIKRTSEIRLRRLPNRKRPITGGSKLLIDRLLED